MAVRPNTALDPLADRLRQVHTIPALVRYLHDELGWPVNVDDWEDNLFDWQPDELNLKAEHEIKVKSIKQLRPLVSGQPWGIFFVEFNKGHLPITALRRVLNGLVPKGRAHGGGHQTWKAHDLLFVSSFGENNAREIALAHFTDESSKGDLPTLRVLGWDDDDTPMQLGYVAQTLREKLRWPASTRTPEDLALWRQQWSSAFTLRYGQVINDSKTLALAMAELAKRIRRRVNTVLTLESDSGHLRQMHKAFKDNLIADLSDDAFADMFAQTITYGLFTARASRDSGALIADNLADMVPSTNPFLKELLGSFLTAAGRARKREKRVDFDELGINEVVTVLREVPMDAVLRSFNASKPGDDPVIHFYEDFLKAYDKAMRAKRGVFYTPSPVVQFIVRSVDGILRTEFGIEDGLASTITWGEMLARKPELKLPKFCTTATPFVQVLDPATGTGTFVVEVINQVHAHMLSKWANQGKVTKTQWQPLWVDYVKQHLLPRLHAFELMMAPYAIAHMKIGLKLAETGYTFPEDGPRVNVFLTNALEPAHDINPELEFEAPMLAHEAKAANKVKEQLVATVIVGNPPYSGASENDGQWIANLLRSPLSDGSDSFFRFNGADLGERNPRWINNDYVKFLRLAQWWTCKSRFSVVGFITSNSYLDSPTFRGVRQSLLKSFESISIVDLHGSTRRGETADGADENVFEIMEGVSVAFLTRHMGSPTISHTDFSGSQEHKFESLLKLDLSRLPAIQPDNQHCLWTPQDQSVRGEYLNGWPIPTIYPVHSVGVVTARDALTVHFSKALAWTTVKRFSELTVDQARIEFRLGPDARDWQVKLAQDDILRSGPTKELIREFYYRPFDTRFTYYTGVTRGFHCMPRPAVMGNMVAGPNLALLTSRLTKGEDFSHVQVTRAIPEVISMSPKTSNNAFCFPQWLYDGDLKDRNLTPRFVVAIQSACRLLPSNTQSAVQPDEIFHYIYAVLHSTAYRQRYAPFLRTDFPRIPIPGSREVFDALAKLGAELVAWHLLEHPDAAQIAAGGAGSAKSVAWFGTDFSLTKVGEKSRELADVQNTVDKVGKVFVNATSGFANVNQSVWLLTIGGYQVLHKWLDDRRKAGRSLSQDDITHWLRIYAALEATQKLMLKVDEAIAANGGWPGAFSQNHPPPDAATLAAEQMAQKEQLKAQKKVAAVAKKRATHASPTGATSLFDFDDDLDGLAAASGAPPRPKSRATPASAAGGTNNSTDWPVMCAIRTVLGRAGATGLVRVELIRQTARELGHARTGPRIAIELDSAIRRAVKRGIATREHGTLRLVARSIEGYDRAFLKQHLLRCLPKAWLGKADVSLRFARGLGFARTGPVIFAVVESLVHALIRSGDVERDKQMLRRV